MTYPGKDVFETSLRDCLAYTAAVCIIFSTFLLTETWAEETDVIEIAHRKWAFLQPLLRQVK